MKRFFTTALALLLVTGLLAALGCDGEEKAPLQEEQAQQAPVKHKKLFLAFGGGPTGGTFNFFANKIASTVTSDNDYLDLSPKGSAGSAENLRALHQGSVDLSIVYSGDAYLGRNGELVNDSQRYDKVRAMAYLYGAPAQLVVRRDLGVTSAAQLEGMIVAVGNPGSGAALSAERFFSFLGLWDKIEHRNLGYSQAAADFSEGKIDAFWVLTGFPNSSVIEAASRIPISLVAVGEDAARAGMFAALPFYTPVTIPAGTYGGQDQEVSSFQDASLLCASETTPESAVHDTLATIFSEQGLQSMVNAHRAAREMSLANGIKGISIPLHPGAVRFWEEQGLMIPASIK